MVSFCRNLHKRKFLWGGFALEFLRLGSFYFKGTSSMNKAIRVTMRLRGTCNPERDILEKIGNRDKKHSCLPYKIIKKFLWIK